MKLHLDNELFNDLVILAAEDIDIPESAVRRDYHIVMIMERLQNSEFADLCVFKGGTSLSKCYPGSIERFSEDIDLTFMPGQALSDKQYSKAIKKIEKTMAGDDFFQVIGERRSNRSKSSFLWLDENFPEEKVKLEIGSMVRPDPVTVKTFTSYIQEYLAKQGQKDIIKKYELKSVSLNTLCIERTFIDKVFSVRRHAICGSLNQKVRHIYDVVQLMKMDEIKSFLDNSDELKSLIQKTKETDSYYIDHTSMGTDYDPSGAYAFDKWEKHFDDNIKKRYESLHTDLLYTNIRQDFTDAVAAFRDIDQRFKAIGE